MSPAFLSTRTSARSNIWADSMHIDRQLGQKMCGSPIQCLAAGSSEHHSDTIKGRSKEGNCCNINDGPEGRPHVTTVLLSSADVKPVPPWAVLTGSGRGPAHRKIGSSVRTVAMGLHEWHGNYLPWVRFQVFFLPGKVNPKPPTILESDLAATFSLEVVTLPWSFKHNLLHTMEFKII